MRLGIKKFKIYPAGWKKFFKKLPENLVKKASWIFFSLIVLDLVIGASIFYKFVFLVENQEIQEIKPVKLEQEALEEVVSRLARREKEIEEIDNNVYSNIFSFRLEPEEFQPELSEEILPEEETSE